MKRNFRYITKFEEETRSARLERRDVAYKSVVNSYFENVGIFYENDEVNVIDDKHATTKVPQTIGGWQNGWNSKQFVVPVGLPCRPATNLPQEGWWLDHTAPKVKAFIKKVIAMQVEHPEFEKNSSFDTDVQLETREAKRDWRKYIEFIKIDGNDPAQADELGVPLARGYYFNYIGNDFTGDFGAYKSLAQAKIGAKKDFEENFDSERSSTTKLDTRMASKPQPRSDKESEREIALFIVNTESLGSSTSGRLKHIIENLARKMNKQNYDKALALKLYSYLVEEGIKSYNKEFGKGSISLSPASRLAIGAELEEYYVDDVDAKANELAGITLQGAFLDAEKKRLGRSSSARLETRGYGLKATDVIGYAWEGELLTVEFVKHLFKTKQVKFDADSLKGRKDMNGIPEGLTANGEEYMPIFGSTELDESDRKMLEEGRSS